MPDWLAALQPWWPDAATFLRMGRHGAYVWSTFGLCALALALEWHILARQAARLRERQQLQTQALQASAAAPARPSATANDNPSAPSIPHSTT